MTQAQKLIRNRLGLLKLAQTPGSVSDHARCSVQGTRSSLAHFDGCGPRAIAITKR